MRHNLKRREYEFVPVPDTAIGVCSCCNPRLRIIEGVSPLRNVRPKNELTREKLYRFLETLNPDIDRAGEEYEQLRFRLFNFFFHRQCRFADELADETINRVILKAAEERIESVVSYCYGVAKNVYRESLRKQKEQVRIEEAEIPAPVPEEQSFSRECLDRCLQKLSPENKEMLLDYFSGAKQAKSKLRQSISRNLNMTQTALRMRVKRHKDSLKVCIKNCMNPEGGYVTANTVNSD